MTFCLIPTEIRGLERLGERNSSILGLSYPEGPVELNLCFIMGMKSFIHQMVIDSFFRFRPYLTAKAEGTQTVRSVALRNTFPSSLVYLPYSPIKGKEKGICGERHMRMHYVLSQLWLREF